MSNHKKEPKIGRVWMILGIWLAASLPISANLLIIPDNNSPANLAKEVRHQLLMLPFYNVFDNLEYKIEEDGTVILSGQVIRPTLRSDAGNVVKRVPGVGKVVNNIEVTPLSPMDDRIRLATYRAIYYKPGLDLYALQAVPPIHIIVKNGEVTLTGVVARQMDKNIAGIAANGVPGVFQVTNNLTVEK